MSPSNVEILTRRQFLTAGATLLATSIFFRKSPAWAFPNLSHGESPHLQNQPIALTISDLAISFDGRNGRGIAINGTIPGPIVRLKEGQEAVINVTNKLSEASSIHWHGLILPPEMDGVPGVSFAGIGPGETFEYRFNVKQSGTYWCHSHSGGQELLGVYAPLIIDPIEPDPIVYDRDYVVLLSDWSFESPMEIIANLKKMASYYNYQKRTLGDFVKDSISNGLGSTIGERMMWNEMNMDPTDISDVTGATYVYLMNGMTSLANWTGIFTHGERIRLRFIDAGAMTFFDVRIPGLKMTVIQADGQNIQPVEVDEFRIGPGETYDVIVEPSDSPAYTIFAETIDRSGFARGTLAIQEGLQAEVPEKRKRPIRSMQDMGMGNMDMGSMKMDAMPSESSHESPRVTEKQHNAHSVTTHTTEQAQSNSSFDQVFQHDDDYHGIGSASVAEISRSRLHEPGLGLGDSGRKVLVYSDLRGVVPSIEFREPHRDIELHLTGNMERYMWSIDGKKYSEAKTPIPFEYGERLRLILVNDTMMEHPMHLHGMWMELENGAGRLNPRKHTVVIKPAERLSVAITADAKGLWAFHCHLLLHMEMGMFRVVEVKEGQRGISHG